MFNFFPWASSPEQEITDEMASELRETVREALTDAFQSRGSRRSS